MEPTCPKCHAKVELTDLFCATCGTNLKKAPLSTSLLTELMYYAGSILLPPLGIWWGIKYFKQGDPASKRIGMISIILTTLSFIITSIWAIQFIGELTSTFGGQIDSLQGL